MDGGVIYNGFNNYLLVSEDWQPTYDPTLYSTAPKMGNHTCSLKCKISHFQLFHDIPKLNG